MLAVRDLPIEGDRAYRFLHPLFPLRTFEFPQICGSLLGCIVLSAVPVHLGCCDVTALHARLLLQALPFHLGPPELLLQLRDVLVVLQPIRIDVLLARLPEPEVGLAPVIPLQFRLLQSAHCVLQGAHDGLGLADQMRDY